MYKNQRNTIFIIGMEIGEQVMVATNIFQYWKRMAEQLIKTYNLGPGSKVLDVDAEKHFYFMK